jgi:hypothetical protein
VIAAISWLGADNQEVLPDPPQATRNTLNKLPRREIANRLIAFIANRPLYPALQANQQRVWDGKTPSGI